MRLVQGFGLHCQDDLIFLHEGTGARCLTPGLEGLESPFQVIRAPRQRCPHVLPRPEPGEIPSGRLFEVMAPIPDAGLYWCDPHYASTVFGRAMHMTEHPHDQAVFIWSSMVSPQRTLPPKLLLTNAAPLVISGYGQRDFQDVVRITRLPRIRTTILVGYPQIPGTVDVTPRSDECVGYHSPDTLRKISAAFLHRWIEKVISHDYTINAAV